MSDSKSCTKCGETKPLTEFHVNNRVKDGRRADCRACVKVSNAERNAAVREAGVPCSVEGCGKTAHAVGMCQVCYKRDRYGDCLTGCGRHADGPHGHCNNHRDLGPCQHPDGCDNPAQSRHKGQGPWLCSMHYDHAAGRAKPSGHDHSNDPHHVYLWRHPDGSIAYVGITYKDIKQRNTEHLRNAWWTDNDVTPPAGPFATLPTEKAALRFEENLIKIVTAMGGKLYNTLHNPNRKARS
jgi:hypothetical protein